MSVLRVNKIAASGQTSENTGSVFFDGTGDFLTTADNVDFEFGSGDFSIEAFIYYTGAPGNNSDSYIICSKWDNQASPNDKGYIFRVNEKSSTHINSI